MRSPLPLTTLMSVSLVLESDQGIPQHLATFLIKRATVLCGEEERYAIAGGVLIINLTLGM